MLNIYYKYCMVPMCENTIVTTPNKIFIDIPRETEVRRKWFRAIERETLISLKSDIHCCEDHFDIEKDVANYEQYKLMGGPIKLHAGVVPHKFDCQNQEKNQIVGVSYEKRRIEYRNKLLEPTIIPLTSSATQELVKCNINLENSDPNPVKIEDLRFEEELTLDWKQVSALRRNEERRVKCATQTDEEWNAFNLRHNKLKRSQRPPPSDEEKYVKNLRRNERRRAIRAALTYEERKALNLKENEWKRARKAILADEKWKTLQLTENKLQCANRAALTDEEQKALKLRQNKLLHAQKDAFLSEKKEAISLLKNEQSQAANLRRNEPTCSKKARTDEEIQTVNLRKNEQECSKTALTDKEIQTANLRKNEQECSKTALTDEEIQTENLRKNERECFINEYKRNFRESKVKIRSINWKINSNHTAIVTQKTNDEHSAKSDRNTMIQDFDSGVKRVFCYMCGMQFLNNDALLQHIATHVTRLSAALSKIDEKKKASDSI